MRSTIMLLRLNQILKCRHGLLNAPLQTMELDSLVSLVSQDLIVFLSYVIEYNCPLYVRI